MSGKTPAASQKPETPPVGACQYRNGGDKQCTSTAVWQFPIIGVSTLSCDKHLPAYAKATAKKV